MRIISNFKDYYDGFMDHDRKDPFVKVWVRNFTKDIKVSKYKLEAFDEKLFWFQKTRVWSKYLIVAGKVYPFLIREYYNFDGRNTQEIHYNVESFINSFTHVNEYQKDNI